MIALALSGITAFPLETELRWLLQYRDKMPQALGTFINTVYEALRDTNLHYPMLAYGYDWLAFAHLVITMFFIGPLKDPVKNIWVIEWGMLACIAIIPLAFIAGAVREFRFTGNALIARLVCLASSRCILSGDGLNNWSN